LKRYFPTVALGFSFKEKASAFLDVEGSSKDKDKSIFILKTILAGGIAGSGTALIVYPLDFARTRMGVDVGKTLNERQFKGMNDCLK
jgi:solute carrier family 25 (mitochondrial adenine nucleotide translocator), member 4/5/6/31